MKYWVLILATYTNSTKTNILIPIRPIRPNNRNICCPLCTSGPGPLGPWISDALQTFWDQGAKSKAIYGYFISPLPTVKNVPQFFFRHSIIYQRDHEVSSAITFPSNFSLQMLLEWTLDRTNTLTHCWHLTADKSRQHPAFAATLDKTSKFEAALG